MSRHHRINVAAARAFTLVELIVTIAIIAVMAGLTIAAIGAFGSQNDVRRTESTMEILAAAIDAFEKESGRAVSWGTTRADQPGADVHADVPHVLSGTQLFSRIERNQVVKELLAGLSPGAVVRYDSENDDTRPIWLEQFDPDDPNGPAAGPLARSEYDSGIWNGGLVVLDAWGTPIRAVHPGPDYERYRNLAAVIRDDDGSVRLDATGLPLMTGNPASATWSTEDDYGVATGRTIYFVSAGPDGRFGDAINAPDGFASDNVWSGRVLRPGGQDG